MDINVLSQMEGTQHFFQADTPYKALEGKHTPHDKILRVNSMHRTDLKGVKIGSGASKMRKVCITGSPDNLEERKKTHCSPFPTPVVWT